MLTIGPAPPTLPDCIAASGPKARQRIRFRIGESKAQLGRHGDLAFDDASLSTFTDTPSTLEWDSGTDLFVFEDVGGTGHAVLVMDLDLAGKTLRSVGFSWQNRPLRLAEAMVRARLFESWLRGHGFADLQAQAQARFTPYWKEERQGPGPAPNWGAAEALLADDQAAVEQMPLFALVDRSVIVRAKVTNWRRQAEAFGRDVPPLPGWRRTVFEGTGGHEWQLEIDIEDRRPFGE